MNFINVFQFKNTFANQIDQKFAMDQDERQFF